MTYIPMVTIMLTACRKVFEGPDDVYRFILSDGEYNIFSDGDMPDCCFLLNVCVEVILHLLLSEIRYLYKKRMRVGVYMSNKNIFTGMEVS